MPKKLAPHFVITGLDTEKGEAAIRLAVTVAFGLYVLSSATSPLSHEFAVVFGLTAAYFIYGILLSAGVRAKWLPLVPRRISSIVIDQAFYASVLYSAGEVAAPFLFAPICMSLGTGLRYGRNYAVIAATISSVFITTALTMAQYWEHHHIFAMAYALAVCIIPFYVFRLTDPLALNLRTDFMTKITNRRGYEENLNDLCVAAAANPSSAALVFMDLDGFKQINDGDNHAAGDAILVATANCLSAQLTPFGTPARIGGDEFAVTVDKLETRVLLEAAINRLLVEIAAIGQRNGHKLSASIGIYYFSAELPSARKFAATAADALLSLSKESGKNQFNTSINRTFTDEGRLQH